jgi:hypothetical protein
MEFVKLKGWTDDDEQSFISLEIKNGNNSDSIGDQVWISKDGTEMEVYVHSRAIVLEEISEKFDRKSRLAFRDALRRMGVTF